MKRILVLMLAVVMLVAAAVSANAEEKYREHVEVVVNAGITKLDPQGIANVQSNQLFNMMYNTLFNYNCDTNEVENELAVGYKWNDDFSVLTLDLREGVVFQNGAPFTAEDVAFTLDRATNANVKGSYDHCNVINDYQVEVVLKYPNVDFVSVLSHNASAIVSKANVEADPELGASIGTGPWALDRDNYTAGTDAIELVRNEQYWDVLPDTKTMTVRYIGTASARLIALENDEVQMITGVATKEVPMAQANDELVVTPYNATTLYFISMNYNGNGSCGDENLRRAIACAINVDDIIATIGDPSTMIAKSMWGWQMKYLVEDFDLDLSYNPEQAKAYLAQATSEPVFNFIVNAKDAKLKAIANVVAEQCRVVGITVNVEELDHVAVAARVSDGTQEMVANSISLFDWASDMDRLLASDAPANCAAMADPRADELMKLGVSTDDDAVRAEYYKELQTLIHDGSYFIPVMYATDTAACREGVDGYVIRPSKSHDFSYVRMLED